MRSIEVLSVKRFADEKMQKVSLFDTANCFCDLYCIYLFFSFKIGSEHELSTQFEACNKAIP